MQIKNFWVDIEDANGGRVGRGPLRASEFSLTSKLSASGEFSFTVSAADPNLSALAEKRVAVCKYIDRDGALKTFGGGVIDKIIRSVAADGSLSLHVSGNDLARELTYRSVGALDLSGIGGAGVADAPARIMAFAPSGWTITNGGTQSNVYAGFDGETALNALGRVAERIGEHWRLGAGRVIEWIGAANQFQPSGLRAVQHVNDPVAAETADEIAVIVSLEEESDTTELVTRIIPRGSGNGGAALTLSAVTEVPPAGYTINVAENYVKRDDAEAIYSRIERVVDFKDIGPLSNTTPDVQAAANMLMRACVEHLRRYGSPQKFYRVDLAKVDRELQPGTTMRVVYRKFNDGAVTYDLNDEFNIIQSERKITENGIHTTAVSISTIDRLPETDANFLARQAMQGRVISAHQQLGASVDTMTFRDEMDNAHGASFRFWLGDEYTSIQRAFMRFRIQPLRSTVKSVAAESTTTEEGGGGSQTSAGGGGGSWTATRSKWELSDSTLEVASSQAPGRHYHGIGATLHSHPVDIPEHSHSVDIPAHSHNVIPQVSMQYGIFEESAGNTLALANLVIKLNGGADLRFAVKDISNGWFELDITDALTDNVFRPARENNEITFTTSVAKTARIEAQITIRGVVQAVNYG